MGRPDHSQPTSSGCRPVCSHGKLQFRSLPPGQSQSFMSWRGMCVGAGFQHLVRPRSPRSSMEERENRHFHTSASLGTPSTSATAHTQEKYQPQPRSLSLSHRSSPAGRPPPASTATLVIAATLSQQMHFCIQVLPLHKPWFAQSRQRISAPGHVFQPLPSFPHSPPTHLCSRTHDFNPVLPPLIIPPQNRPSPASRPPPAALPLWLCRNPLTAGICI